MSETEAKIKVKADARDLKAVERGMREAFNPAAIRAFEQSTRILQRGLKGLTSQQVQLVRAMRDVDKGLKTFGAMAKELKEIKTQAAAAQKSVEGLSKASSSMRSKSFVGGVMQGAGVGHYFPADRGMYPRVAGSMVGRGVRRAAGAAAAPFTMPGISGLSTMMQGIPILGGFAAGALQSAAGMYQQWVGHQQARLPNLYFASEDVGQPIWGRGRPSRSLRKERAAAAAALKTAQAGTSSDMQRMRDDFDKAKPTAQAAGEGSTWSAFGTMFGGPKGDTAAIGRAWLGEQIPYSITGRVPRKAGRDTVLGKQREWLRNRYQSLKTKQDAEIGSAQGRLDAAEISIAEAKRGKVIVGRKSGLGPLGLGTRFGYDPTQTQGLLGEFYGASGGLFRRGQAEEALAAKTRYGVGMGASGAFARMGLAGGGGAGMGAGLAGVLQSAFAQGLRGAQVPEYLQTLVQLGTEAEKSGVKLNVQEFTRQTAMLGALGIDPLQRQRITGGLNRAAMQASAGGIQGPAQMLLYRSAGFRPGEGRGSYIRATERLEGGMGSDTMANLLGMVAQASLQFTGTDEKDTMRRRAFHMRRSLNRPGIGVSISSGQATEILSRMLQSPDPTEFKKFLVGFSERHGLAGAEQGAAARGSLVRGARALARRGAGGAVSAAGLQASRIGVGGSMSGTFRRLEGIGIQSARVLSRFNKQIGTVVNMMQGFLSAADKIAKADSPLKALWDLIGGGNVVPSKGSTNGKFVKLKPMSGL